MIDFCRLAEKPTLNLIPNVSTIDERVHTIIDIVNQFKNAGKYYYPHCLPGNLSQPIEFNHFGNWLTKKYVTERGEIFRHPERFNQLGGDCDDQTIYALIHQPYFPPEFAYKPGNTKILILQNYTNGRKFLHITQKINGLIVDFLPYAIPSGTTVLKIFDF